MQAGKIQTVQVPHLGGITAAYQIAGEINPLKPTLILVNSFTTSSDLYNSQYKNKSLTEALNLVAIELLGHGQTRCTTEHFTYWDTAIMNLQVMDALNIPKAFVLGTSQGGWITVRMALLAPDRILGIIPLGTSMDYESDRTRKLGCWEGPAGLTPLIDAWSTQAATPDFELPQDYCDFLLSVGFGAQTPEDVKQFWSETIKRNYKGNDGRRRVRMAAINLRDRDGLHGRVGDVKCPVHWMHGTADKVYSVPNAQEEIKLFTGSSDANLQIVQDGEHFLSFSHPKEVDEAILNFVKKHAK